MSVSVAAAGEAFRQVSASLRTRTTASGSAATAERTSRVAGPAASKAAQAPPAPQEPAGASAVYEISARQVIGMVADGYLAERHVWDAGAHGDANFLVLLAAYRVTALAPGIYRVGAAGYRTLSVTNEFSFASLRVACGAVPAVLLICADLHERSRRPGGCSYGALLVRAGTLAYGIQLSARVMGVPCSVYGSSSYDASLVARACDTRYRNALSVAVGTAPLVAKSAGNDYDSN